MTTLSYKSSVGHLVEREKNILSCILLSNLDQLKINYQLCADEIGMSKGGFENAFRAIIKKLKTNNCYIGEEAVKPPDGGVEKSPKKAGGRKRKAGTEDEEDDGKSPMKKGRNSTKAKATDDVDEENDEDEKDGNKSSLKQADQLITSKIKAESADEGDQKGEITEA